MIEQLENMKNENLPVSDKTIEAVGDILREIE